MKYVHGIRPNIGQFAQQLLQVLFVGLTIGMQRNVVPALAGLITGYLASAFDPRMSLFVFGLWVAIAMDETLARINPQEG